MAKYKVYYSGFAYIEADSVEEVKEKYADDDFIYDEKRVDGVIETDEFTVDC